jgi:hypothetical protein
LKLATTVKLHYSSMFYYFFFFILCSYWEWVLYFLYGIFIYF